MIQITRVSHSYRVGGQAVPVLRDVDLSIGPGELVAIKGASGSGKSTLLYVLGCLLRPDSGTVRIAGQDIAALSDKGLAQLRNREIGFVFQQFHLLPRASVVDNVLLPACYPVEHYSTRVLESRRERAVELARELGLGAHLQHLPNQLSGGQQQRVAIARALLNDAHLILADEPTGNLDSKNAAQTLELLKELHRRGRTVVIVTHDSEVARSCDRVLEIKDGAFLEAEAAARTRTSHLVAQRKKCTPQSSGPSPSLRYLQAARALTPLAFENLRRNKGRSALTMLGIVIGIAAVLSMVTIAQFTKTKILETYEALGVNKADLRGYPNWRLRAVDKVSLPFRSFDWQKDIEPLRKIFPNLELISPVLNAWNHGIDFGGRSVSQSVRTLGVNHEYLKIANREILSGSGFSPFHIENRSSVCLIGTDIVQQLFAQVSPIGQIAYVTSTGRKGAFGCKIIGVLKPQSSNNEWNKPNLHILLPYTYYMTVAEDPWEAEIHEIVMQVGKSADIEKVSKGVRAFFERKYGESGSFFADSDAILIAQMKKFLNIFSIMLASIALLSLLVGAIGITNMMLVSVVERYKEIGLRKALGATSFSIRVQFLLESVILCLIAGVIGIALGFAAYEIMIYGASKFVPKVRFEWIVDPGAMLLSALSILAVGIASGLVPALKAEKLEVIEALRSE